MAPGSGQAAANFLYNVSKTCAKILDIEAVDRGVEFEQVVRAIAVAAGAQTLLMVLANSSTSALSPPPFFRISP